MSLDYDDPENDLRRREALSADLRRHLFRLDRGDWRWHPRFGGLPSFWMSIHASLREGCGQLVGGLEALMDEPATSVAEAVTRSRIVDVGDHLVGVMHQHHNIEDAHYFPLFLRALPTLRDPLLLLDGDHRVVGEAIAETEAGLDRLRRPGADRDAVAGLLAPSRELSRILLRHLHDEEEVVIPLLLHAA